MERKRGGVDLSQCGARVRDALFSHVVEQPAHSFAGVGSMRSKSVSAKVAIVGTRDSRTGVKPLSLQRFRRWIAPTLALFLATSLLSASAHADRHGGWHGGGHGGVFFDFGLSAPYYPYAYAPYPYYYPPSYYVPPTYYTPAPAPVAPAPSAALSQSWYYCDNPQGYYPYIASCAGGWRQVPAQPQ
jgi:hypothetical protein